MLLRRDIRLSAAFISYVFCGSTNIKTESLPTGAALCTQRSPKPKKQKAKWDNSCYTASAQRWSKHGSIEKDTAKEHTAESKRGCFLHSISKRQNSACNSTGSESTMLK